MKGGAGSDQPGAFAASTSRKNQGLIFMTTHTEEDSPRLASSDPTLAPRVLPVGSEAISDAPLDAQAKAEAERKAPPEPEPERVMLHMPVDIRSMSLVVLAIFASLFVLHWAKADRKSVV